MDRQENHRKWQLSRRRFLQIAGAATAVSLLGASLPSALLDAKPNADSNGGSANEEGAKEQPLRRWMMIIDLRKCDGCQSQGTPPQCTEACILGHFVPEPMQWIQVYEHDLADPTAEGTANLPKQGTQFVPTPCMECQNPPCVNVCPVGATWSTPEGMVLIDQNRCIGCRLCMAACPYERRFFTWGEPSAPPQSLFMEYSPEHQIPKQRGVVYKCDFCPDVARAGRLPFCADACSQGAIYYGDLEEDVATNGNEVVRVSRFLEDNAAYRMKEELGTRPRVYYIPGYGEEAGRDPNDTGQLPVTWNYSQTIKGARTWQRSGR